MTSERGLRGRRLARTMLVTAGLLIVVVVLLLFAEPNTMGGGPRMVDQPLVWLGIAAAIAGFIVMVGVDREARHPERHATSWRSLR